MKRTKTKNRFFAVVAAAALILCGCRAPKIKPSAYQVSLNEYYAALSAKDAEACNSLAAVEQQVTLRLANEAADPQMRMLRASIRLARYRMAEKCAAASSPADLSTPAKGVAEDAQTALDAAGAQSEGAEWISARAFIVLGDLMLLAAGKYNETGKETPEANFVRLAHYEVAAAHFARAHELAEGRLKSLSKERQSAAAALQAQLEYARDGLIAALIGRSRLLTRTLPTEVLPTLSQIRDLQEGKETVWSNAAGFLPGPVIGERDPVALDQLEKLQESIVPATNPGSKEALEPGLRMLRLAALRQFHEEPWHLPASPHLEAIAKRIVNFAQVQELDIKVAALTLVNDPKGQSVTLQVSSSNPSFVLPRLLFTLGNKTLEVPQPMMRDVVIKLSQKKLDEWVIHIGGPPAGGKNVKAKTENLAEKELVVRVDQFLGSDQAFFGAGDLGKELEVHDVLGKRHAAYRLESMGMLQVEADLERFRKSLGDDPKKADRAPLRAAALTCPTLEDARQAHTCFLKVAGGYLLLQEKPTPLSEPVKDVLGEAGRNIGKIEGNEERAKAWLAEIEFIVEREMEKDLPPKNVVAKIDDLLKGVSSPEAEEIRRRLNLLRAEFPDKFK